MSETNTVVRWKGGEVLLPNELERRQIFYILKRNSSYTAMKRSLGYYQKWADVAEKSVKESDERGLLSKVFYPPDHITQPGEIVDMGRTSIRHRDYVRILQDLALFDEGVRRLGQGDKRVFTYSDYGLFMRADRIASHWSTMYDRYFVSRDNVWMEETPYTEEFFKALDDYGRTGAEAGRYICEGRGQRDLRRSAPMSYTLWHIVFLPKLAYPNPLPEIPKPTKNIIIATGETVPYSGIFEPVENGNIVGTMNYLHGDSPAPLSEQYFRDISDETYGYDSKDVETRWRLIWRDDRYEDGTIPEEEKNYIFTCPVPQGTEDPYDEVVEQYLKRHNLPNPLLIDVYQPPPRSVPGGKPCTKAGRWATLAQPGSARNFKEGEIMPDFPGASYGATFWQWIGPSDDKTR